MSVDIQFVSKHPIAPHGTTQLRCNQPAEYLRALGFSVSVETIYNTWPKARKLIFAHRVMLDSYTRDFLICAKARGCKIAYDTDDLLFDADGLAYLKAGQKAANYTKGAAPYADAMAVCDAVCLSTEFLAKRSHTVNPRSQVLLNALSESYMAQAAEVYEKRRASTPSETVTMAYLSGSKSHDADFKVAEPALLEVLERHPNARLVLVGSLAISTNFDRFGTRVERRDFVPYDIYPNVFEDIDINLIPLEIEHAFCHAKSELKFIEAGACGVVSTASPTQPHRQVIEDGRNGHLVTGANWAQTLSSLIESTSKRRALGDAARQTVLDRYTSQARTKDYANFVNDVLATNSVDQFETSNPWLAAVRLHMTRNKRAARRKLSGFRTALRSR